MKRPSKRPTSTRVLLAGAKPRDYELPTRNICMTVETFRRFAVALRTADEVLQRNRFAAMDQNPQGVRDLIGVARVDADAILKEYDR